MRVYNTEGVKMTPLAFIFVIFCTLLVTVSGQTPIVSTNTITTGGKFSVSCDASRAVTPPGASGSVQSLYIYRMVATDRNYSLIAQYNSLAPPGFSAEFKNIPSGRLWNFTFSGASGGLNNAGTMRIMLDVNDAMCSDAGMYRCLIDYYTTTGTIHAAAPDQNVTASMGLSGLTLSVQPDNLNYYKDDNITFTCKVTGPATGVSFRWELWVEDGMGNQQPTNLPNNNEIVNNPAAPQTGSTGCPQFDWVSTLSIQVPADYEQQMYKCIVSYMQMEQSSNWTIGLNPQPSERVSEGSSGPDVGMIVGIVIGCVVAILIVIGIIFFIRYRKRSQENRSGDKDQHDAPNDANLHAPPPVFFPSKQSKASKDEDSKTPEENERREIPRYYKNENNRHHKPSMNNSYEDNYNYEQEASNGRKGRRNRQGDSRQHSLHPRHEQHYASTDVSQSGDESADFSDSPLDGKKSKPRPKSRSQTPSKEGRDGHRPLHYAELDLPKRKDGSESSLDAGRRRDLPVEYAEIRV